MIKKLVRLRSRVGFLLASILFAFLIGAPSVYATGYTFTDLTSSGPEHGLNWASITSNSSGQYLAATAYNGDIYVSSDYGQTWTDETSSGSEHNLAYRSITSSSSGQYMATVANDNDVYTSNNYGQTWTNATPNSPEAGQSWITVTSSSSGQYIYAVADDGGGVFTSTDYGATWTSSLTGGDSGTWWSAASSSSGQYVVAIAQNGDIWTSSNYGTSWTDDTPSGSLHDLDWRSVASNASGQYLATEIPGVQGVYTSSDYGQTWTENTTGLPGASNLANIASSSSGQYLSTVSGDIYTSSDYGQTWTDVTPSGSFHNLSWSSISSNFSSQYLLATVGGGGDIYEADNPDLAPSPPTVSNLSVPMIGSWITNDTPTFSFTTADTSSTQVKYEIQVSQHSNFSSPAIDYTSSFAAPGAVNYTPGSFLSDGSYYWRVQATDGNGESSAWTAANSGGVAFQLDTTAPSVPGTPTTTTPTTSTKPTWTWGASTDSGSGLAATPYTVEWSQDSNFASGVSSSTSTTESFTQPSALAVGTWYFRVKASDVAGEISAYSSPGEVIIESPPAPPSSSGGNSSGSSNSGSQSMSSKSTTSLSSTAASSSMDSAASTSTGSTPAITQSPNNVLLNNSTDFSSGIGENLNLVVGQNVRFSLNGIATNVTVQQVGGDYVTLTIGSGSDSREVTIRTGQTDEYDVGSSSKPDISVKLIGTSNGIAELSFASIKLAAQKITLTNSNPPDGNSTHNSWYWLIVIAIIIAGFWIVLAKKRRHEQNQQ